MSNVVVVGLGYVGLPLAMRAAEVGHKVVGYDTDASRVKQLETGSYIEDVPASQLAALLDSGAFTPSSEARSCAGFDVAVISVPTPLREGLPDLTYIESACRHARAVPAPRLDRDRRVDHVAGHHDGEGAAVAGGRLRPDRRASTFTWATARSGSTLATRPGRWSARRRSSPALTQASLAVVQAFYAELVEQTVAVSSPAEAELAKIIENTFRHVNIALINELAMCANGLGIDVWAAIGAASTKPFGFMPFTPGPGVGGHCLPIDPSYLSWRVERALGQTFRFVELANDINNHMPDYVVRRLMMGLNQRCKAVSGLADPAARARLQEEHRRREGVAGRHGWPACWPDSAPTWWPPTRTSANPG